MRGVVSENIDFEHCMSAASTKRVIMEIAFKKPVMFSRAKTSMVTGQGRESLGISIDLQV